MAKKLYVGSLSYSTTDESLRKHFSQAGAVTSATVVMDKMTGRSRGFGFVVNEARPLTERPPRRSMGGPRHSNYGRREF